MIQKNSATYTVKRTDVAQSADRSLKLVLWTLWTLAVAGTAIFHWRADIAAERPLNLLGLVIYSVLTGLIGLLVITLVELRLDPDRFLDY
jgi:hypothetical protein